MAIKPDKYVVTSVSVMAITASGHYVEDKPIDGLQQTIYGIYKDRYFVNWEGAEWFECNMYNKDYAQEWNNSLLTEEIDRAANWDPVQFYDAGDKKGRRK